MDLGHGICAQTEARPTTGGARHGVDPRRTNTIDVPPPGAATPSVRPRPLETDGTTSHGGAVDKHAAPSAAKRRRKGAAPTESAAHGLGTGQDGRVPTPGNSLSHGSGCAGVTAAGGSRNARSQTRAALDTLPECLLHHHVLAFVGQSDDTWALRTLAGVNKALYASTLRFPYTHFHVTFPAESFRGGASKPTTCATHALANLNTSALTSLRCFGGPTELAALAKATPFPHLTTLELDRPLVMPSTVGQANTVMDSLLAVVRACPKLETLMCNWALWASNANLVEYWRPAPRVWEAMGRGIERLLAYLEGEHGATGTRGRGISVDVTACRHAAQLAGTMQPKALAPRTAAVGVDGVKAPNVLCARSAPVRDGSPSPRRVPSGCEVVLCVPAWHLEEASDYATPGVVFSQCDSCMSTMCLECLIPCSACGTETHDMCLSRCGGSRYRGDIGCRGVFAVCRNCEAAELTVDAVDMGNGGWCSRYVCRSCDFSGY